MPYRLLALLISALFVLTPSAAFAASATQDAYDDTTDVAEDTDEDTSDPADDADTDTTSSAQPTPSTSTGSSNLPFTGLEAGLIAIAGVGLAGTGAVLRRAARTQD